MTTVTIGVSSLEDAEQRLADAFNGKASGARISFASEELLWKVLTAKRWALLRAMTGQGTLGSGRSRGDLGEMPVPSIATCTCCSRQEF